MRAIHVDCDADTVQSGLIETFLREPRNQLGFPTFGGPCQCLRAVALTTTVLFLGCAAQRPVLYPTERLAQVGAASEYDVSDCQRLADANVSSTLPNETVRETAIGAGIGAASGVVGGAIFGSPGTGAAVGAASGATASLLGSLLRPHTANATNQNYVTTCLSERGYRVVGWQ